MEILDTRTKLEKIKQLNDACEVLKKEFIGLEEIIDSLKKSILPWYVTPEVIERPVVVSLWGMTGTGKTSVINRLVELLDLKPKSLFFDCGKEVSEDHEIDDAIKNYLTSNGDSDKSINTTGPNSLVLIFDEFQYARTINEHGEEVDKPSLRPIWSLLDNGKLHVCRANRYDLGYCNDFIEDFLSFAEDHQNIPIKDGYVEDKDDVKTILETMGLFYYDRGIPGIAEPVDYMFVGDEENKTNPYRPLRIVEERTLRILLRKSSFSVRDLSGLHRINDCKTVGELANVLLDYKTIINTPELIDCSNSLVFVIGNLDEAFSVSEDLNPDINADIFYDETSKVTDSDIKNALKLRFRPEQIARFGNSLLKYPSLKEEHFKKIINKEVSRICTKFESENSNVKLSLTPDVYNLLYSEGVYPTQGVRPVFTTISTIFTPLLSNILIHLGENKGAVEISVEDPEKGFKRDELNLCITYSDSKELVPIKLSLGHERNPENRKTAYICSVHETGHAIVAAYLTGKAPISIVSVSTDRGGFCTTFDKDKLGEIDCKQDIKNDVMISLAGYEAEQLIYSDHPERTLLGSGSDIDSSWYRFSRAAYSCGYYDPYQYTNYQTEGNPGLGAQGLDDSEILNQIKDDFKEFRRETISILEDNRELLVQTALALGERGELTEKEFEEFIEKYGNTLTLEGMKQTREENSSDWYKKVLENG